MTITVGDVLTAVEGTWTGYPPGVLTWQWLRNGVDILGANSATYAVVMADVGSPLSARATRTNRWGSASATSAPTSVVLAPTYTILREDGTDLLREDGTPYLREEAP